MKLRGKIIKFLFILLILLGGNLLHAQDVEEDEEDSSELPYPIKDKEYGSTGEEYRNPIQLKTPQNVIQTIDYNPESNTYTITEKIGDELYRPPIEMTFEEYMEYTLQQDVKDYWRNRSTTSRTLADKNSELPFDPSFNPKTEGGIFRGLDIDIRPQGNVEVTLGGNVQRYDNPNLPQRARTQGGLDFDMNINMNVTGKIGDAMQLTLKYNNQTGFAFDNQFKLQYTGQEDDIIQLIEAGNVSMELPTQLITGVQSLRGIKTQMQFGRLTITSIAAQQQSQKQTIIVEDGAQMQTFELKADQYEADKHFFLAQFFEEQYDDALRRLPNILSTITIEEVEVWVTNRTGQTSNVRDIVALMDLGENDPWSNQIAPLGGINVPDNNANNLYQRLIASPNLRLSNTVNSGLQGPNFNLKPIEDFEKSFARLLQPTEYTLNRELGYISLNTTLQPNQVLGVAFKYNYQGEVYQVGELSRNVPPDSTAAGTKTLFVKMLRSSSIRPDVPTWNLMMKNIYSLGAFQISPEDFRLDVFYIDPGGGQKRFLPASNLKDDQLIRVLQLDNLNNQGDPQPDGIFDFIPDITIQTQNGRLVFPVTKPFGEHLEKKLVDAGSPDFVDRYVFNELYDSTIFVAQQFPEKNRFKIKGRYKGAGGGNRIMLGAFQLPEGSVTVSMGGQMLQEGVHYTVDYNMGAVTIIDEGVLNSGQQIKVDFENNAMFGFQQRSMLGTRLDYRVTDDLFIGGTLMNMRERPFSQKVNLGQDPINNTIMGLDMRFSSDVPIITKILDKLPFYSTKEMSQISFSGEVAHLRPGNNRFVGQGDDATVYIDDFEGSSSAYDLKGGPQVWKLSSTPQGAVDRNNNVLFPEADLISDLRYNYNRAKLSWYNVDPTFFQPNQSPLPNFDDQEMRTNHYVRQIFMDELFPNRDIAIVQQVFTLDLAYYPNQRGPYNYERRNSGEPGISRGVRPDGRLIAPETRWGGMMRGIENNNFEVANIEYIEFWMMDPFIYNDNRPGGQMYIHLGSISEDILKDSRMQYEHGLSLDPGLMDETVWGQVPKAQPIVNAFDNNPDLRVVQDVGLDGLNDDAEREHFSEFLQELQVDPEELQRLQDDPSSDNFRHYLDPQFAETNDIISRYKNWNNPHGNSPVLQGGAGLTLSGTNQPDMEDLNRDNSLNENEEYFQYIVDLYPGMDIDNHPYIISTNEIGPLEIDGFTQPEFRWYQFRIPIREFDSRIGNIQDFRSIQYLRMVMSGWEDSVVIRFGTLELIRNQWRTFQFDLSDPTDNVPIDEDQTTFTTTQVNVEENSNKQPVNYVVPPGIVREQALAQNANQLVAQNEQAMALNVCGLADGDARAVFKPTQLDLRNYKRIIMDLHANNFPGQEPLGDDELTAFIRLGIDFRDNFYQYEVPLKVTPDGFYNPDSDMDRILVWPEENKIDLRMDDLVNAKKARTEEGWPINVPYKFFTEDGKIITIKGIPDLGSVEVLMLGIKNPAQNDPFNPLGGNDDGRSKCGEVWFNELRLAGFDDSPGSAALANLSIKLADLGNINFSTNIHSIGFGQVDMQVDERYRSKFVSYDLSANLELGKFLPQKANIRLPFFGSISQGFRTPQYDPYQLDIETEDQIEALQVFGADSARTYKRQVQTIQTRRGFNFTNVRKLPGENQKRLFFFSPENFAFTYAYNLIDYSDPFVETDYLKTYVGRLDYTHAMQPKYIYPFKKLIKGKIKMLDLIREINFNFLPTTLGFNTVMNRQFGELKLRSLEDDGFTLPTQYNKFFTWDRNYTFRHNPFKSLSIDYSANNMARIDEPFGAIDTDEKKEEIWGNILQGGRTTTYTQNLAVNYTLPINKLPFLDFTNTRVSYNSAYNWIAAPLAADEDGNFIENSLGNTINNSQQIRLNSDLNFEKLYNKSPYLKKFNGRNPTAGNREATKKRKETMIAARNKIDTEIDKLKQKLEKEKEKLSKLKENEDLEKDEKKEAIKKQKKGVKDIKKQIKKKRKDKKTKQKPANILENLVMQPLVSIKKVNVTYSENRATTLPGFMPQTSFIGIDRNQNAAPGYGFVFGAQPGFQLFGGFDASKREQWLQNAADQGWMSEDTLLNQKMQQTYTQNLNVTATIEPFRDLKIDLTLNKTESVNYSQFFKKFTGDGDWETRLPMDMGSLTYTTITWRSMFQAYDDNWVNETYTTFTDNRTIISARLQEENPNSTGIFENPNDTVQPIRPNYAEGYGPTSQDVLIPAFLAAYKGQDPNKTNLFPLRGIPLPNWQISYNGLTKFKWAQDIFANFSIRHGYSSTVQINSFQTNFDYEGSGDYFDPSMIDPLNGNFFALYNMPSIMISEQLNPLIGFDMTFKNGIQARIDYKSTRQLAMNFTDFQMIENNSTAITTGIGYRVKGLKLPFKSKGKKVILHNDLNMRFDFTIRDNVIINHLLDQGVSRPTAGARIITISPSIDYVINRQLTVRLFVDRNRTTPRTSISFPTTTTRAGITMRFSLANF